MKPTLSACAFLVALCLAGATPAQGQQPTPPTDPGKASGRTSGAGIPAQGTEAAPAGQGDKARPAAQQPRAKVDAPSAGVREPAGLAEVDREFMRQAAHNGLAEVEASALAQQKATRGDVKAFAGKMVEDHNRANEELKRLAAAKNLALPVRPAMPQRSTLNTLRAGEGGKFERDYVRHFGVKAHEDNVKLFRTGAEKARDADVKAFAQKTLSALEEHLAMAKALQEALEPTAGGRGEQQGDSASKQRSSAVDASATPKSGK